MRQSIGAAWIFSIVITFIMIFTAYLAVTVNYAKAFKIKNNIISMIENNEGLDGTASLANIEQYLISNGYKSRGNCDNIADNWDPVNANIFPDTSGNNGVCIYEKEVNADTFCKKKIYRVVTFFDFDLPVIGNLLTFSVKGNSMPVYDLANNDYCIRNN